MLTGTNSVAPAANVSAYAIEDSLPPEWTARGVSDGGAFDSTSVPISGQRQSVMISAQPRVSPVWLVHLAVTNGQFQFDFTSLTGLSVILYATTNQALPLSQWRSLGTPEALGGGAYRFTDPATTNYNQRFYRLR